MSKDFREIFLDIKVLEIDVWGLFLLFLGLGIR